MIIVLRDIGVGVMLVIGLAAYLILAFLIAYAFSFRQR
jgi:hypothetical protein